ncbi:hypothetical protein SDC9_128492 [bioreactor metagenome]|uniref:Uncharacterized protein n=1 Tax=bioreactor metagenome TaxID=1076179 RepID=A0A645CX03_9ZZZZ
MHDRGCAGIFDRFDAGQQKIDMHRHRIVDEGAAALDALEVALRNQRIQRPGDGEARQPVFAADGVFTGETGAGHEARGAFAQRVGQLLVERSRRGFAQFEIEVHHALPVEKLFLQHSKYNKKIGQKQPRDGCFSVEKLLCCYILQAVKLMRESAVSRRTEQPGAEKYGGRGNALLANHFSQTATTFQAKRFIPGIFLSKRSHFSRRLNAGRRRASSEMIFFQ